MELEKKAREIEAILDTYHKSLDIFKHPRNEIILHTLRGFEDMSRFGAAATLSLGTTTLNISINRNLDCLDTAIKWIYECTEEQNKFTDYKLNGDLYILAGKMLMQAGKYRDVVDSFTLWSRGRQLLEINEENKILMFKFPKKGTNVEASDFIFMDEGKNSFLETSNALKNQQQMANAMKRLPSKVKVENGQVTYEIDPDIWKGFEAISLMQIDNMSELPEDWEFRKFSLREFKCIWNVLLTKSLIHSAACFISGAEGAGLESILMVSDINELSAEVATLSELPEDKVRSILDFITYNPNKKTIDIVWQPLISLDKDVRVISPHLIITSSAERNLITLINQIDQPSYSRISSTKEGYMASGLKERFCSINSNVLISTGRPLPDPLPDMDFVLYDPKTKFLFVSELKWLISTDSIKEVCARDIDLAKGISQAELISAYVKENISDVLMRAFGNNAMEVEKFFVCVTSKNNMGTSELSMTIPIVNERKLIELFESSGGDISTVAEVISNKSYLPKEGVDYKIVTAKTQYAGYQLRYQAIQPIEPATDEEGNRTYVRSESKIGRNDPCPCGAINPSSGKPMKYKKCCGK